MTLPPGAGEHRPHGDLPPLPAWAKTLQRRIRQRGLDFFILYGPGVRDLHPLGARRFGTMGEFLSEVMLGDRSALVTYDRGGGIGCTDRDVENDFQRVLSETTAALSSALVADARTFEIAVPVPDEPERFAYLATRGSRPDTFANVDARRAAILTAGLTRLHLESLLSDAEASGTALDQDA